MASAQCWFEWRAAGKTAVMIASFVMLGSLAIMTLSAFYDDVIAFNISWKEPITLLMISSAILGLWATAHQSVRSGAVNFLQIRPVSEFQLTIGKLQGAAAQILINAIILTLMLFAVTVALGIVKYGSEWATVFEFHSRPPYLLMLPCAIFLAWLAYWRGGFMVAALASLGVFSENAPHYFARWIYSDASLRPGGMILVIVSLGVLSIPFLRAYREGILPRNALLALIIAWAIITAIGAAVSLRCLFIGFAVSLPSFISALAALLALTPFARVTLKISHARHR
jgi:hypothetical protein